MASVSDFATWEPVLRLLPAEQPRRHVARPVRVAGRIGRHGWSLALKRRMPPAGRAAQVEDSQEEFDAVERVQSALADAGVDDVSFTAEIQPTGTTVLRLLGPSPAVEPGTGTPHPGALILADGALPEPWRRPPEPAPDVTPAPSADLELLERTLRERLPHAIGATEEEIAAAEARLGVTLPDELKVLYRVTRARWRTWARTTRQRDASARRSAVSSSTSTVCTSPTRRRASVAGSSPRRPGAGSGCSSVSAGVTRACVVARWSAERRSVVGRCGGVAGGPWYAGWRAGR
ncbi:hypothetical protein ACFWHQ_10835 [Streptomyces sp. NPDC060334]|uniref:hypothetical protein n=1 Tax=Streptomyces sp. NPDC060334 TaxID=3347099 RepID=UPI003661B32A